MKEPVPTKWWLLAMQVLDDNLPRKERETAARALAKLVLAEAEKA